MLSKGFALGWLLGSPESTDLVLRVPTLNLPTRQSGRQVIGFGFPYGVRWRGAAGGAFETRGAGKCEFSDNASVVAAKLLRSSLQRLPLRNRFDDVRPNQICFDKSYDETLGCLQL
ncbi:hypothetical protein U1Q18_017140 [Sarracenia purpurea var. burkii]